MYFEENLAVQLGLDCDLKSQCHSSVLLPCKSQKLEETCTGDHLAFLMLQGPCWVLETQRCEILGQ